jgi:hypothetical protein
MANVTLIFCHFPFCDSFPGGFYLLVLRGRSSPGFFTSTDISIYLFKMQCKEIKPKQLRVNDL